MKLVRLAALVVMASIASPAAAQAVPDQTQTPEMNRYTLKGAPFLRPVRIGDDGVHTYIEWSEDQPIPAVFALDRKGNEQVVNGYMRDKLFTIDGVFERLVFQIDKDKVEARRNPTRGARNERGG